MKELRGLIRSVRTAIDALIKGLELTDGDLETLRDDCDAAERELNELESKQEADQQ